MSIFTYDNLFNFEMRYMCNFVGYARIASAVLATAIPSVRPSVRLSV